ncbi:MAG: BREX system ATP-binding domain-containing protein, partial [Psittacicella sp.]
RNSILNSLRAGISPSKGLGHIKVGRIRESNAIDEDIEIIKEGGSRIRIITGEYGAGKSFFLELTKQLCIADNLVVIKADISNDAKLYSNKKESQTLYTNFMDSLSFKGSDGEGSLEVILERFIEESEELAESNSQNNDESSPKTLEAVLEAKYRSIGSMGGAKNFVKVIKKYVEAYNNGDDEIAGEAIRWLKAGYNLKSEAKILGVTEIINDDNYYKYLKIFARFVSFCGFNGLMVIIDEAATILAYKNAQTRQNNYEKILQIWNDTATIENIGFIISGTPDLVDPNNPKGMASYEALATRIANYNISGKQNYKHNVLTLENLTEEDTLNLLKNIRTVYLSDDKIDYKISDEDISSYIEYTKNSFRKSNFCTPREIITKYISMIDMAIQESYPSIKNYIEASENTPKSEEETSWDDETF